MANFQLNAPKDFQTERLQREQLGLQNEKARNLMDLVRPSQEADIEHKKALTGMMKERTKQSRQMFPTEKLIKKIQAKTAQEELGELLATKEGRMISHEVQKLSDQDLLERWETDPEGVRKDLNAEARYQASQADLNTYKLQRQAKHNALTFLTDLARQNPNDLSAVNAALPYINQQYKQATGHDLSLPQDGRITLETIGMMNSERKTLEHDIRHAQNKEIAEIESTGGMSDSERRQRMKRAEEIAGTALKNQLNYEIDTDKNPMLEGADEFISAQINELDSLVKQITSKFGLGQERAVATALADTFKRETTGLGSWQDNQEVIMPKSMPLETVEEWFDKDYESDEERKRIILEALSRKNRQALQETIQALGLQTDQR